MTDSMIKSAPSFNAGSLSAASLQISVVTVVRNGILFIAQTIESVVHQTYPHVEYIVIDGGSTDGTVDIIRAHDNEIAYWVSEKDQGIADAFNKGLARATGDYLLFLNSDDALAQDNVIARIVELLHEHSYPEILYGN